VVPRPWLRTYLVIMTSADGILPLISDSGN